MSSKDIVEWRVGVRVTVSNGVLSVGRSGEINFFPLFSTPCPLFLRQLGSESTESLKIHFQYSLWTYGQCLHWRLHVVQWDARWHVIALLLHYWQGLNSVHRHDFWMILVVLRMFTVATSLFHWLYFDYMYIYPEICWLVPLEKNNLIWIQSQLFENVHVL